MEILCRAKNSSKGLYVVNMQNINQIKIGRGSDSHIRMTEISVSRNHATIKL